MLLISIGLLSENISSKKDIFIPKCFFKLIYYIENKNFFVGLIGLKLY